MALVNGAAFVVDVVDVDVVVVDGSPVAVAASVHTDRRRNTRAARDRERNRDGD